jgi:hypothetical protein
MGNIGARLGKLSLGCLQWKPASAASAVGEEMMSILNWDCAKMNDRSTVGWTLQ